MAECKETPVQIGERIGIKVTAEIPADADDLLNNVVLIKNKAFKIRKGIPDYLPSFAYYLDDYELMPLADVPARIQQLRAQSPSLAQGLIPAARVTFNFLQAYGIAGEKMPRKWAIIPTEMMSTSPVRVPGLVFFGEAKRSDHGDAHLTVTLAETALKKRCHATVMANSLIARIEHVIPKQFMCTRNGDFAIRIHPRAGATEEEQAEELPVDLLKLIPGIAKLYDTRVLKQPNAANLYDKRYGKFLTDGGGGVPVLVTQRMLCLMSGGLDSPVAAYRMMCRGVKVDMVHYLNATNDTSDILTKIGLISKRLSMIQGRTELLVVDISELQNAIIAVAPRTDRTLLYKQFMLLLSAAIPNYLGMITGDSIGQVASQTPQNISALYPHVGRAVLSPLAGSNKVEIVHEAMRLGLYELSIMKGADCCQYLSCTSHANLSIGAHKLRRYMSQIDVSLFKIDVVVFEDGAEVVDAKRTMTLPFDNPFLNAPEEVLRKPVSVARLAKQGRPVPPTTMVPPQQRQSQLIEEDATAVATVSAFTPQSAVTRRRELYFDCAAATTVDQSVQDAMIACPSGNPNSLHTIGRRARAAVEGARHQLLNFMCPISPSGLSLVFTGSGTEANNMAIRGVAPLIGGGAVLYSPIGHPSLIKSCEEGLAGAQASGEVGCVQPFQVDPEGIVDLVGLEAALKAHTDNSIDMGSRKADDEFRAALRARSRPAPGDVAEAGSSSPLAKTRHVDPQAAPLRKRCLVVIDLVNHELGTLQPMEAVRTLCDKYGALLHVDACQALCKVSDMDAAQYTTCAVTAHKINGPLGVGAISAQSHILTCMDRVMVGGSYDGGIRPGTENAPAAAGFAAALNVGRNEELVAECHDYLIDELNEMKVAGRTIRINGHQTKRTKHIVHITVLGGDKKITMSESDMIGVLAAKHGVMISSGAACSSTAAAQAAPGDKPIYKALNVEGGHTLRVSFDHSVTRGGIAALVVALRAILDV